VLVAQYFGGRGVASLAGAGAFVGHLFPAWLGFKGGKGVATYIGVLLGIGLAGGVGFLRDLARVAALTRYSSLAH